MRALIGCLLATSSAAGFAQPSQAGSSVPARAPIILLGASFAQGWRLPDVAGSPVVNRGISGQQTFELLERFDRDVIAARPRAVIIWGHINDVFRTPPDSIESGIARARDSYAEMVRKARAAGIEVILATEITVRRRAGWVSAVKSWIGGLLGRNSYVAWVNRNVTSLNEWLHGFAAREGIVLLDLQPVIADARGRRRADTSQPDGTHVAPAGYDALTAYTVGVLERHFTEPAGR